MVSDIPSIAVAVVQWQAAYGRNHLPWQQTRDPYRVWLSEIMLQQTQVSTVLGYYERFLERFPDVMCLASAAQDDVMALWSGLGYYSRARNLHQCARKIASEHGGQFPSNAASLATLPGIGRSTAAAIASFCFGERAAILDANVKRVLTRVLAYGEDLSCSRNEKALWTLAEQLLPTENLHEQMPRYTQGLMDLGAAVCVPRNPLCLVCPLHTVCCAARQGNPQSYPVKTRKIRRSTQTWWLLVLRDAQGRLWLQRRPVSGGDNAIWAGLYSPMIFSSAQGLEVAVQTLGISVQSRADWPVELHVLTHRDLHLYPVVVQISASQQPVSGVCLAFDGAWWDAVAWEALGLPAPVRKLLLAVQVAVC